MRKSLLLTAVLGALFMPAVAFSEEEAHSHPEDKGTAPATAPAAEPTSPHTFTYNIGLYSQYIFRGLTQTREDPALQGGVDYSHSSGFYLGAWGSNISWLTDGDYYKSSSLELDLYGGFASTIGETGVGYNVGLLQYIYPGSRAGTGAKRAETTEVYGSLSYKWLQGKVSVVVSDGAFGFDDADGSTYSELNLTVPFGSGFSGIAHVGYQDFTGSGNSTFDYADYKLGLTKSWSNGFNVGAYYTDTDGDKSDFTDASGQNIAKDQFTVFVQKTF